MIDPCDNCNKPCCYGCEHAETDEAIAEERKEHLTYQIHLAEQIVYWLSYQPEMSDSECRELKRMTAFLENLRDRL